MAFQTKQKTAFQIAIQNAVEQARANKTANNAITLTEGLEPLSNNNAMLSSFENIKNNALKPLNGSSNIVSDSDRPNDSVIAPQDASIQSQDTASNPSEIKAKKHNYILYGVVALLVGVVAYKLIKK